MRYVAHKNRRLKVLEIRDCDLRAYLETRVFCRISKQEFDAIKREERRRVVQLARKKDAENWPEGNPVLKEFLKGKKRKKGKKKERSQMIDGRKVLGELIARNEELNKLGG